MDACSGSLINFIMGINSYYIISLVPSPLYSPQTTRHKPQFPVYIGLLEHAFINTILQWNPS